MANGIRTLSGSVNGTMTYFTNNYPTLTTLSGTAVWGTTYILGEISSLSFTIPSYNVNNGTQEIRVYFTTGSSINVSINTSNFTTVYGLEDITFEAWKSYELSFVPLNNSILTVTNLVNKVTPPFDELYTRLEYIANANTNQYINMGIYGSQDTVIEYVCQFDQLPSSTSTNQGVVGAAQAYNSRAFESYMWNGWQFNYGTSYVTWSGVAANTKYVVSQGKSLQIKNASGTSLYTYTHSTQTFTTPYVMTIWAGNRGTPAGSATYPMRLWELKVYEGTKLVRDFIPVLRKTDNKVGLYDLCGSKSVYDNTPFYGNSGIGSFAAGNPLGYISLIPTMTSATAPSGSVFYTNFNSSYPAWKAFAGNPVYPQSVFSAPNALSTVGYAFPSGTTHKAEKIGYQITYNTYSGWTYPATKTFVFQGSNDNSTWTNITDSFTLSVASNVYDTFSGIIDCKDSTAYRYFRLTTLSSTGFTSSQYGGVGVEKIQLYIKGEPLIPVMTSNTQPSGTASASAVSDSQAYYAFDNNDSTRVYSGLVTTSTWTVTYNFTSAQKISAVKLRFVAISTANRTNSYSIQVYKNNAWVQVASGTASVGYNPGPEYQVDIHSFAEVEATGIRIVSSGESYEGKYVNVGLATMQAYKG